MVMGSSSLSCPGRPRRWNGGEMGGSSCEIDLGWSRSSQGLTWPVVAVVEESEVESEVEPPS